MSLPKDTVYVLDVISADKLVIQRRLLTTPSAYVKIQLQDISLRSRVVKKTMKPSWDEKFIFPKMPQDPTSILSLQVYHDSSVNDVFLGGVETEVGKLIEIGKDHKDIELKLDRLNHKTFLPDGRSIVIRFGTKDAFAAGSAEIEAAHVALANSDVGGRVAALTGKIDDVVGVASQAKDWLQPLINVAIKLDTFIKFMDATAKIHPYANFAWQITMSAYTAVKGQLDKDQKVVDLLSTIENVYLFVDVVKESPKKIQVLEDTIIAILRQTFECSTFVREHTRHGLGGRMLRQTLSNYEQRIDGMSKRLLELKSKFDAGINLQNFQTSFRIEGKLENLIKDTVLQQLNPVGMIGSDRAECLPNTRVEVLRAITQWATDPSEPRNVFWLHGFAGAGKSALSTSVANFYRELHRLGAFLFFDRNFQQQSDPRNVVTTLAHQLGKFDNRIGRAIAASIENSPGIGQSPFRFQVSRLLVEPLSSPELMQELEPEGPILVVMDALDECGSQSQRKGLLPILAEAFSKLPSIIRILVTSRKEDDIERAFKSQHNILPFELEATPEASGPDILRYLRFQTGVIREFNSDLNLPQDWPGEDRIQELGRRAAGLFVWASTACLFIEQGQYPEKRLKLLLETEHAPGGPSPLDQLYKTALESSAGERWKDSEFRSDFQAIIGTILVAISPLTETSIDRLLGRNEDEPSSHTISRFRCVIYQRPTVRVLHRSFADYLQDQTRCGSDPWFIHISRERRRVAIQCLARLDQVLRRNVGGLTLSLEPWDVELPEDIPFLCTFWIDHVCLVTEDASSIADPLDKFLYKHLLHWLEAMSILKLSVKSIESLRRLHEWISTHLPDRFALRQLVYDANRFVQTFSKIMAQHPLLVYTSALTFTPVDTELYKRFRVHDVDDIPRIVGRPQQSWSQVLMTIRNPKSQLASMAFSRDGQRIAASSSAGSFRVWDVSTGAEVFSLGMKYHQPSCIAISTDGSRIAFDANTSTVRVWDVVNDVEILPRLVGNRGSVFSIAFSVVDNSRIVAAGRDYLVHVWDTASGAEVLRLKGHSDSVNSVAFSTDGSRIVSGADDKTVRLWSVASQAEALPALHGHKARVTAVAFSRDGERVVSGSRDKLIYVWDAQSGDKITVLPGHGGPVSSVAFFPDGLRIVSGADDKTIRLWDVASAREVISPLREIAGDIQLALSPDGFRLVSASPHHDAIRIWDLTMNTSQSPLLPPYQGPVQSMALSPDGTCVAFSSPFVDVKQPKNSIHIWEVASGAEVLILQSDMERVDYSSITFSPNGAWLMSYERARSAKSPKPSSYTIRVWNPKTGAEKMALKLPPNFPEIRSLAFSPDGARIASNSFEGTVCVWDAESGAQIFKPIKLPEDASHQLPFRDQSSVTFSHGGTKIAAASHDFCAYIRDATSGEELTPPQEEYEALIYHDATIWSVAFSPDDEQIISQSRDGTTCVWNATTGEQISLQKHNYSVGCHVSAPIVLRNDGWIVDTRTRRLLSHLPDDIYNAFVLSIASSETLLALGTEMGLFIMRFPSNVRSGMGLPS